MLFCVDCFNVIYKTRVANNRDIYLYEVIVAIAIILCPIVNVICMTIYFMSFMDEDFSSTIHYNVKKYSFFKFLFKPIKL